MALTAGVLVALVALGTPAYARVAGLSATSQALDDQARTAFEHQNLDSADRLYAEVVSKNPDAARAILYLAMIKLQKTDYEKSIALCSRCLDLMKPGAG